MLQNKQNTQKNEQVNYQTMNHYVFLCSGMRSKDQKSYLGSFSNSFKLVIKYTKTSILRKDRLCH